ncbi:hypothetical protein TNCV_1454291 [Trichonephila clavipes]|nr:hypothetical protein TNCV_1454291 [Trichonephila clavipes]
MDYGIERHLINDESRFCRKHHDGRLKTLWISLQYPSSKHYRYTEQPVLHLTCWSRRSSHTFSPCHIPTG